METIGNINLDELDDLKLKLKGCGYRITDDALAMIEKLENQMVTLVLNHQHYSQWAANEMKSLIESNYELRQNRGDK